MQHTDTRANTNNNSGKLTLSNDERWQLNSPTGLKASISPYGASLVSLSDCLGEVIVTPKNDADLVGHDAHFGATVGPVAGRIKNAKFVLDGTEYALPPNNNGHLLHGGADGFSRQLFTLKTISARSLTASYTTTKTNGFAGTVTLDVTYTLDADCLHIDYSAQTTAKTPLNLTNHAYFALDESGSLAHTSLKLLATKRLEIDDACLPTGKILSLQPPYDFVTKNNLRKQLLNQDKSLLAMRGFDHPFLLNETGYRVVAHAHSELSNRHLKVWTDAPILHLYTANWLSGEVPSNRSFALGRQVAFCLEAESYPDAPNQPNFPDIWLNPDTNYERRITYQIY